MEKTVTVIGPCVFCSAHEGIVDTDKSGCWTYVVCQGYQCFAQGPWRDTKQAAIAAWNAPIQNTKESK